MDTRGSDLPAMAHSSRDLNNCRRAAEGSQARAPPGEASRHLQLQAGALAIPVLVPLFSVLRPLCCSKLCVHH